MRAGVDLGTDPQDDGAAERFTLHMDAHEVGLSMTFRVAALIDAMGPLVAEPFRVCLRAESMSDDRDQVFYGGPNAAGTAEFEGQQQIKDALECLGGSPLAAQARASLRHIARWSAASAERMQAFKDMTERQRWEKARRDALEALAVGDWGSGKPYEKPGDARATYEFAVQRLAEMDVALEGSEVSARRVAPNIVVTIGGGAVQEVVVDVEGTSVMVVDYDSLALFADSSTRVLTDADGNHKLATLMLPEVTVDAGRAESFFQAARRQFAFAERGADWFNLEAHDCLDFDWLGRDGVILDVTDPTSPELALAEMHFNAQDMGAEMHSMLSSVLEGMELAAARGDDANPGFDAKRTALCALLDASPWIYDPDQGCVVRRDEDEGAAGMRERGSR